MFFSRPALHVWVEAVGVWKYVIWFHSFLPFFSDMFRCWYNKSPDRSMEVKLPDLSVNYDRPTNRQTGSRKVSIPIKRIFIFMAVLNYVLVSIRVYSILSKLFFETPCVRRIDFFSAVICCAWWRLFLINTLTATYEIFYYAGQMILTQLFMLIHPGP